MEKYNEFADATRQQHQVGEQKSMEFSLVIEEDKLLYWLGQVDLKKSTELGGVSEATVYVVTTLGSVNLEYFFWRAIGNVNCNYCGTTPNVSGIHEL
ncbi:hypothetical protein FQA39_LY00234 [Lamprigera yunnana]|nr:hypothetical protein FQA39_LY00234 [Lamprigera yunnana]